MAVKTLRKILICDASDPIGVSDLVVHLETERLER